MTKKTEYSNLLSFWHKLEHFTPATLPKTDVKKLSEILPWDESIRRYPKDPKKTAIIHTVYLGVFQFDLVADFIKKFFEDDLFDQGSPDRIFFASLKVSNEGVYFNDTLSVSTLPWALGQLEKNQITESEWSLGFEELIQNLRDELEDFREEPLNKKSLQHIQELIIQQSDWSLQPETTIFSKTEEIRLSSGTNGTDAEAVKADLLNSFYINDLEKIIESGESKHGFSCTFMDYLNGCLNKEMPRIDLKKEIGTIAQTLRPSDFPDGCWPSRFKPALMQQFAVSAVLNKLSGNEGIFSVNGPPGTGKTTLLRDVIAGIIVEKAKIMAGFSNPSSAFTKIGQIDINDQYTPYIYAPSESLCDSGIVVTSSNNGAVENISKELPLKKEVEPYDNVEYFRKTSEICIDADNWGLIAAALGNKQNRSNLVNSIWFNSDENKKNYTLQQILKNQKPSDEEWKETVSKFKNKLKEVESEKNRLSKFEQDFRKLLEIKEEIDAVKNRLAEWSARVKSNEQALERHKEQENKLLAIKSSIIGEISTFQHTKPGFFSYWFNRTLRKEYQKATARVLESFNKNGSELEVVEMEIKGLLETQSKLAHSIDGENKRLKILTYEQDQLLLVHQGVKEELGNSFADENFWNNLESKECQETTPWYSDDLKKLQSELFVLAMRVNETFILKANSVSSRILTTLAGFFHYLKGDVRASHKEVKAMWDTFFLVIPVVSTTFASIDRMFGNLKPGDIPWLFIDEAGQAVPQAAAGAIWRSKRVVVVGDPFQIEPVVTIPPIITENFRNYFNIMADQVSSALSVQSMADRANKYGWYNNDIWIGSPLRVHRRCVDPMFKIANEIAYDGMMFNSTFPKKHTVNFKTQFISVKGSVEGRHYVPAQGEIILEILKEEIDVSGRLPDLFIISPFAEIPSKLKKNIYDSLYKDLKTTLGINSSLMHEWLNTHIGTVHTFQGKQADGVILCLGLDNGGMGAARWASSKPNLLNVALTRAKHRFIAIGDPDIWLNQPYFQKLKQLQ